VTRRLVTVLCLLALPLAAAPAAEAAKRKVPRGFYGTVFDGPIRDAGAPVVTQEFGLMASSGVESVRTNFFWGDGQPARGVTTFAKSDLLVGQAAAHGVELLPVVTAAPRWARKYPGKTGSPPRRVAEYTAYLELLARRYGPNGSFWAENPALPERPIRTWQIWNEPQLPYQWHRPAGQGFRKVAPAYGALLRASRTSLRRVERRAKVVLAGLTNRSWSALEVLFERGRIRRQFDVLAMNAYSNKAGAYLQIAGAIRKVLRRNRQGGTPIWVTEFTGPAAKGRIRVPPYQRPFITDDRGMARLVGSTYRAFATRGRRLGIKRAYWYTWASSYQRGRPLGFFEFAGLRRFAGGSASSRPALRAYRASARRYQGCAKDETARCR
jgi:hypothetical protein